MVVVEDIRDGGGLPHAEPSRPRHGASSFPVVPPRRPGQLFDAVITPASLVAGAMSYLRDCDAAIGPVLIDGLPDAPDATAMWLVLPGALGWLRRQVRPGAGPVLAVHAEDEVPELPPRDSVRGPNELRWLHLPRMIGTWTSPVLLLGALGMAVLGLKPRSTD
jgi:hypothetical protein